MRQIDFLGVRKSKGIHNFEPENNSNVLSKTYQSDRSGAQGGVLSDI